MSDDQITKLKNYGFQFSPDQIAQEPAATRTDSRLLVRASDGKVVHSNFSKLAEWIPEGALIIMNDTRVYPARIITQKKSGGKIELFLLECINDSDAHSTWKVLARPLKYFKDHSSIELAKGLEFKSSELYSPENDTPFIVGDVNASKATLMEWLETNGSIPLPPYIRRSQSPGVESEDYERYQTTYANLKGSVAAPTAGLHFDKATFYELAAKNIEVKYCTLHVGGGTFLPIKAENILDHKMHKEWFQVPSSTITSAEKAQSEKRPVIFVGTTTLRAIESLCLLSQVSDVSLSSLAGQWLSTELFIHPTDERPIYRPHFGDAIITNFHQPESSLLVLISALIGSKNVKDMYSDAVRNGYRLFSYGDSSLLWL